MFKRHALVERHQYVLWLLPARVRHASMPLLTAFMLGNERHFLPLTGARRQWEHPSCSPSSAFPEGRMLAEGSDHLCEYEAGC